MAYPKFDRFAVQMEPLAARDNKKFIERDHVAPTTQPPRLPDAATELMEELAERIRRARDDDRPVMMVFGAHAIKNGLGPVFLKLVQDGWVTHLATNGAGIIHDWEFAFQGKSCENVEVMVREGRFGNWQETGFYINLALNIGAFEGRGYGESVGALIHHESLRIPSADELESAAAAALRKDAEKAAATADLLHIVQRFSLRSGRLSVPHPWKRFSAQAAAFRAGLPFTGHPMIGHDIIYNHPMNHGAAIGRAALRDFLRFAHAVARIEGGVYLSVGSAVMSPMIFEKALAMAQNLHAQRGAHVERHFIVVVDLAESAWNWTENGEPPQDHPAYYLRYCKTFSRMGGEMRYVCADNRDFLLALWQGLRKA